MVFVYGSLHKKCLVLWKERYFVLKVRMSSLVSAVPSLAIQLTPTHEDKKSYHSIMSLL